MEVLSTAQFPGRPLGLSTS